MKELSFLNTLASISYPIEIIVIIVSGIVIAVGRLDLWCSDRKQTVFQLIGNICAVLLFFLGAVLAIAHRTESIASKAKDANQATQVTYDGTEIADLKHALARAVGNQEGSDHKRIEEKKEAFIRDAEERKAIAQLREVARVASRKVVEANQFAEKERAARLDLEARVAPRDLSGERQRAVADGCKPFAGRSVRVASYSLDAEAARFGKQILVSLKACGIDADDKIASLIPIGSFWVGLHVTSTDIQFATALSTLLLDAGKLAVGRPRLPSEPGALISVDNEAQPPDAVIMVGVKPDRN